MDDHVVGASGFVPTTVESAPDHPDSPASFTALTLKKYVSPDVRPVTVYVVFCILFITVVEFDAPK